MEPRVAILTPTLPPDRCGVGDHSAQLARALRAQGAQVGLWSAQTAFEGAHTVARPWNLKALRGITRELLDWRPDAVLLQYTPQLYRPELRGVHPALPWWLGELRRALRRRPPAGRQAAPVALLAHELNYPAGLDARGLLLGVPQWLQFAGLAAQADHVFYTYKAALQSMARRMPWKTGAFSVLPVGSNIDLLPVTDPEGLKRRLRQALGLEPDTTVLLHFGGSHPTHLVRPLVAALERACRLWESGRLAGSEPVLAFAGSTPAEVERKLRGHSSSRLLKQTRGLGYLEAARVSEWLQAGDLVLAPFMDGVSTRRGSFMAALAHGAPVVTTRGWATSDTVPWEECCHIVPVDAPGGFGDSVDAYLRSRREGLARASAGRALYEERFSWAAVSRALLQKLDSPVR